MIAIKKSASFTGALAGVTLALLTSCAGPPGPAGPAGPAGPPGPAAEAAMWKHEYINPEGLPTAPAFTVVRKVGPMVFIAAQIGKIENGKVVSIGNAEAQVREIWDRLDIAMAAAGGTRDDIVATWSYITKPEYSPAVTKVRIEKFPKNPPTTSKPLVVTMVHPNPDVLVSISAIAIVAPH